MFLLVHQIAHPSSHCLAVKPNSIISVFSCIGNWLWVQYFEESAVTRQCRALIRSVWVWPPLLRTERTLPIINYEELRASLSRAPIYELALLRITSETPSSGQ